MDNDLFTVRKKVLITGGSGLIGRHLTSLLLGEGFDVAHLSRKQNQFGRVRVFRWDPQKGILDPVVFEGVDYIIHLAGANIGERKWSQKRKMEIESSRINSAKLLFKVVSENRIQIKVFVSASAIGYYGSITSDKIFREDDPSADDFLGNVCRKWEETADLFTKIGARVVKIRSGVVMEKNDSALSKFLMPARLGIFLRLGNGRQYVPWIHPEDLCNIYLKAIQDEKITGAYNAVNHHQVTQSEFMSILARVLRKFQITLPVPALILRLALGEMSVVALKGSRITAEKILSSGYSYKFNNLEDALKEIIENKY